MLLDFLRKWKPKLIIFLLMDKPQPELNAPLYTFPSYLAHSYGSYHPIVFACLSTPRHVSTWRICCFVLSYLFIF